MILYRKKRNPFTFVLRRFKRDVIKKFSDSRCFAPVIQRPCHTSQVAMIAATECGFEILPHTLYSPDMAPSDFYLFPTQKSHLPGTQYGSNEDVIEAVNEYLGTRKGLLF